MDVSTDCLEHSLVCRHGIFVHAKVPALTVLTVVSEVLSLAGGLDPLPIDTGRQNVFSMQWNPSRHGHNPDNYSITVCPSCAF